LPFRWRVLGPRGSDEPHDDDEADERAAGGPYQTHESHSMLRTPSRFPCRRPVVKWGFRRVDELFAPLGAAAGALLSPRDLRRRALPAALRGRRARCRALSGGAGRGRPTRQRALPRLDPFPEIGTLLRGDQLLDPGQHLTLFLVHVVIDARLEGRDPVVELVALEPSLAQHGDVLLDGRVLAERFVHHPLEVGIAGRLEPRIEDLLFDAGVDVQLAADRLDGGTLRSGRDRSRYALHQSGEPAAAVVAGEQLLDLVVILLDQFDDVHAALPRTGVSG